MAGSPSQQSGKKSIAARDREILLGPGLAPIPERLLLAHARGEVLFLVGAGISRASGLPNFEGLVLDIYKRLDPVLYNVLAKREGVDLSGLMNTQIAEMIRFDRGEYDVVLGMLERRIDSQAHGKSRLRQAVATELARPGTKPSRFHRALMRLANRGSVTTIVTTNFDLLLEDAVKGTRPAIQTYALGGIPRPGRRDEFAGILHIHGVLDRKSNRTSDLILTDQDFGEFYLRRRAVSDFIYDAARLFNLVLIGYSANDPPMRYLLSAVAADGTRFDDLKERFAFIDKLDPVNIEDWKGRGITPISYDKSNEHEILLRTLERWASLSAINGKRALADSAIKRIVRRRWNAATEEDRDIFDHLIRRGTAGERRRIAELVGKEKSDLQWLDAMTDIASADEREYRR